MEENPNTNSLPQLNLPPCALTLRTENGRTEVFDPVRQRYVALTPEEWVRQHVIHLLVGQLQFPQEHLQVEGTITLNGMSRRCDIVVFNSQLLPAMIVECKKPAVALTQKVLDQATRYNLVLNVPYLYLTNGLQHRCFKADPLQQRVAPLPTFPRYTDL